MAHRLILAPLWLGTLWLYAEPRARNDLALGAGVSVGVAMLWTFGLAVQSVVHPPTAAWWRAWHPLLRLAVIAPGVVGIFLMVTMWRLWMLGIVVAVCLALLARKLYRMWALDRRPGNDIIEARSSVSGAPVR